MPSSRRPPGETMKVFILKEGKEYNQGVAYLDDGTMWWSTTPRMIGKTIATQVTSVLQTTAGKMIFGRFRRRRRRSGFAATQAGSAPLRKASDGQPRRADEEKVKSR